MARELDPPGYVCADHKCNLTEDVVDSVDTIYPISSTGTSLRDATEPTSERRFRVIVTCPGTGSDSEHDLVFEGTWR